MIVRWGLAKLPKVLGELGIEEPLLVASERWAGTNLGVRTVARWTEVPSDQVAAAAEHVGDGVLAVGGGSAIDLGKAVSVEAGVPVVSVPTTYAGAEWTPFFGIRDPERRMRGGGVGAQLAGVVYEPELTLSLRRPETVGTALNALAHSAEALYVDGHNPTADEHALEGAKLIGDWLPRVVARPQDLARAEEAAQRRDACRHGARRLDARPRPRDGAGPRRPLRPAARRDERPHPAAGAALQRRRRPGRPAPLRRSARNRRSCRPRRGACTPGRVPASSATSASPRTNCPRSPARLPSGRARRRTRER